MQMNKLPDIETLKRVQQEKYFKFLCDWKKSHEDEYLSYRNNLEALSSEDTAIYEKLFDMAISCLPTYFLSLCHLLFGIEQGDEEIPDEEKEFVDDIIEELFDFEGYLKVDIKDGKPDIDFVLQREESNNSSVYFLHIKGKDEWWSSIPTQYRLIALAMFRGITEEELKSRARRIIIAACVYSPIVIENLCELAEQEQDPTLLSCMYYISFEHGFRNISKNLGGFMATGGISVIVPALVGAMTKTSVTRGFDKKTDWKKDSKNYDSTELRHEVMNALEDSVGKHGRPRLEQEVYNIDEWLVGEKLVLKKTIMEMLEEMEHDYELAYLWIALLRSNHLKKDTKFSKFFRVICGFANHEYQYDRAQRMATLIEHGKGTFESSKKPSIQRGRRWVNNWTNRLTAIS